MYSTGDCTTKDVVPLALLALLPPSNGISSIISSILSDGEKIRGDTLSKLSGVSGEFALLFEPCRKFLGRLGLLTPLREAPMFRITCFLILLRVMAS